MKTAEWKLIKLSTWFAIMGLGVVEGVAWAENLTCFSVGLIFVIVLLSLVFGTWKRLETEESRIVSLATKFGDVAAIAMFAAFGWFWCSAAWTFTSLLCQVCFPAWRRKIAEDATKVASS